MPESSSRSLDLENLLDSLEDLCEAGRELLREKATLKAQEKLVGELGKETRELLAVLEAPAAAAAAEFVNGAGRKGSSGELLGTAEALAIVAARQRKGLSQPALGKKVGVTGPSICNIEKRRQKPSPELLARIRKALDIQTDP